jgi:hypothetical protein
MGYINRRNKSIFYFLGRDTDIERFNIVSFSHPNRG